MLGKLLKYEFKNSGKIFLPLFGIVLVISLLSRILMLFDGYTLIELFMGLSILFSIFTLFACNIGVFGIQIYYFYKTTFGDQGYLSHTLPVRGSNLLFSKLLVAATWTIISGIISALSVLIMTAGYFPFEDFAYGFDTFITGISWVFGFHNAFTIILAIVLAIAGVFMGYITFFAAIIIGHRFGKHKILGAIATYIAIGAAMQIINTVYIFVITLILDLNNSIIGYGETMSTTMNLIVWPALIINFAVCAVLYILSHNIMNKKIDLD